jgi:hypothetical protein
MDDEYAIAIETATDLIADAAGPLEEEVARYKQSQDRIRKSGNKAYWKGFDYLPLRRPTK